MNCEITAGEEDLFNPTVILHKFSFGLVVGHSLVGPGQTFFSFLFFKEREELYINKGRTQNLSDWMGKWCMVESSKLNVREPWNWELLDSPMVRVVSSHSSASDRSLHRRITGGKNAATEDRRRCPLTETPVIEYACGAQSMIMT